MRVLLAIGEGLRTMGANQLRQSFLDTGFGVVMIGAESHGAEGISGRPDRVDSVGEDPLNPVFRLGGSPTDCVHFAIGSGLIDQADVVIAGLHADPSPVGCGRQPALAAAMEAVAMARPGIALEIERSDDEPSDDSRYMWSGVVLSELAALLAVAPLPIPGVLHVRVPVRLSGRAIHHSVEIVPVRSTHLLLSAVALDSSSGRSVAPLEDWTRQAIITINPRLGVTTVGCEAGCCG